MRIEIVVFDGFDDLDAVAPFEVLRNAGSLGAGWDVALVGARGAGFVAGSHGLRVEVAEGLGRPDALIVPGGGWGDRAAQGTWAEAQDGHLPTRLATVAPAADGWPRCARARCCSPRRT
jgi:putative intracellular protease/amidase